MAQAGQVYRVSSVDGDHFTDAIVANAAEAESFTLIGGRRGRYRIRAAVVISSDNLAWEFWVYRTAGMRDLNPNLDVFCGRWGWQAINGEQVGAAGLWYYYIDGLDIAIEDVSESGQIHLELVNRSAGAKTAFAAGGRFRLELLLEPTLGF